MKSRVLLLMGLMLSTAALTSIAQEGEGRPPDKVTIDQAVDVIVIEVRQQPIILNQYELVKVEAPLIQVETLAITTVSEVIEPVRSVYDIPIADVPIKIPEKDYHVHYLKRSTDFKPINKSVYSPPDIVPLT